MVLAPNLMLCIEAIGKVLVVALFKLTTKFWAIVFLEKNNTTIAQRTLSFLFIFNSFKTQK
jgi:hypothetical protein